MKKTILTLTMSLGCYFTYAQTNTFPSSGNVGIGTTSPTSAVEIIRGGTNNGADYNALRITTSGSGSIYGPILYLNAQSGTNGRQWGVVSSAPLDALATGASGNFAIYDGNAGKSRLVINNVGYSAFGSLAPKSRLHIADDISMNSDVNAQQVTISGATDDAKRLTLGYDINGVGFGYIKAGWYNHQWTNLSLQPNGGNVGIGTVDPKGYKLAVAGSAIAESVTVKLQGSWPDYVFKPSYNLKSLSEVKTYIDKNSHLPDMPSEQEVAKNGINLGEIVKLQTQKIEELTLYLIDKEKQLVQLQDKVTQLEKSQADNKLQETRIGTLEKALLSLPQSRINCK